MRVSFPLALVFCIACKDRGRIEATPSPERQSPQAQVVPAPLGQPVDANDAGAEASLAILGNAAAPDDVAPVGQRALSLQLSFRSDTQTNRLVGQLGASRMWLRSSNEDAFPMPYAFELRARADRVGHLLVWESGAKVRALPPGGLRPFFADGSFDVLPLAAFMGGGSETVRQAPTGRVHLQKSKRVGMGDAGNLLAKMLAEFAQATPFLIPCAADEYPSKLVYEWPGDARETMTITVELGAKQEPFDLSSWAMPPAGAAWGMREDLPAVRLKGNQEKFSGGDSGALTLTNRTNLKRLVLLDGTPVAWLAAGESLLLDSVRKGSYPLDCRSFWGDERLPGTVAHVPGKASCGDLPSR